MKALLPALALASLAAHAAEVQLVVGKASKPIHSQLTDGETFTTGAKSKSHVGLSKGFFRIGSDTGVQVVTSNHLSLEKGIMLAGSDPGRFRRATVSVRAPGYKMEVRGTAQIAYYPGSYVKITVLEGKVRVALQSLTGEAETLEPGQMLIINPSDKRLPDPVEVDIGRLASTSQLIGGAFGELSTQGLIDAAAATQGLGYGTGDLARTPLQLAGASPEVALAITNRQPAPAASPNAILPAERTVFNLVNDLANPNATVDLFSYANGTPFTTFPVDADGNPVPSLTLKRSGARTRELKVSLSSEVDDFGQYVKAATLSGTIAVDANVFAGTGRMLTFEDRETPSLFDLNDYTLHVDAAITTPDNVGLRLSASHGLAITAATLHASTSTHPDEVLDLRATQRDITITRSDLVGYDIKASGSTAATTPQNITVDSSQLHAQRDIAIGIPSVRSNITLQNSSQLAALVGSITVVSKGGQITVDASTLTAAVTGGKSITLDAFDAGDPNAPGLVTLRNATLSADIIRVRGSTPSGDGLVIDGGTFNATTLLKLYAESANRLLFKGNVQLNTPLAILSGQTVEVQTGGTVHASGQVDVYSDHHNYNQPGYGTIQAGAAGLNQSSHSNRPGF